jgi:hypothetical protein
MGLTVTTQTDGAQLPLDSLAQRFTFNGVYLSYIECDYQTKTYRQTFNYISGYSITEVTVTTPGFFPYMNGYTINDPSGLGQGVELELQMTAVDGSPTLFGTGYVVNDILTVQGGTHTSSATIKVTAVDGSGGVTGFTILTPGLYSVIPIPPAATTGGTGTGCAVQLSYQLDAVLVRASGVGYSTDTTITFDVTGTTTPTVTLSFTSQIESTLQSVSGWELQA